MMLHVVLAAEIMATIMCIHGIYGKELVWNIKTVVTFLGILTVLEVANAFRLGGISSLTVFAIIYIYCKCEFKKPIIENVISLLLCMIIVTSTQYIFSSIVRLIIQDEYIRSATSNIATLCVFSFRFVKLGMNKLQKAIIKKRKFVIVLACFMCLIVAYSAPTGN